MREIPINNQSIRLIGQQQEDAQGEGVVVIPIPTSNRLISASKEATGRGRVRARGKWRERKRSVRRLVSIDPEWAKWRGMAAVDSWAISSLAPLDQSPNIRVENRKTDWNLAENTVIRRDPAAHADEKAVGRSASSQSGRSEERRADRGRKK